MPREIWDQRLDRFAAGPLAGLSLVLAVMLAYWPLSTFTVSISAGDSLDCWLPWRFFIASALQEGAFPAWNPYQQMGYPVHADLQGPAWYPEALIIGGTIGHGVRMLSVLFLAYLALAGEGMRRMVLYLHAGPWSAWLAGMAFALSGFFTGHAMHFYAVIAAAWMPWLFLAVLRLLDHPTPRHAFIVALILFFLLTGGNHTFLIMAAYPLLALGIHALYGAWRSGDGSRVRRILLASLLAIATACLLAVGTLHAVWEVSPYLERSKGLSLEDASVDPFTLRAAWSLLLPWAASANAGELGTDPTMANGHFGLLMLAFALVGVMRPLAARERILLATAMVAAAASLGPALPVHGWLWRWLPGMDLFRFPAYFHFIVLLCLMPFAAKGLRLFTDPGRPNARWSVFTLVGLTGVLMLKEVSWDRSNCASCTLAEWLSTLPTGQKVWWNGVLALLLLALALRLRGRSYAAPALTILVVAELFLAVQVTQWHTAVGHVSPAAIQWRIDTQPSGPVLPVLRPMGESRDGSGVLHHLWRNTQMFRGEPTHDGFNSFWLKDHQALRAANGPLYQAMLAQPFMYLARYVTDANPVPPDGEAFQNAPAVVEDARLVGRVRPASPADSMQLVDFGHRSMEAMVTVADTALLVFQQNEYPGWTINIDGVPAMLHRVNGAALGVVVPRGTHQVELHFHKPVLRVLLMLSYGTFFLLLFGLSWTSSQDRSARLLVTLVLLLAFVWSMAGHRPKAERIAEQWNVMQEQFRDIRVPVLLNTDRPHQLTGSGSMAIMRIDRPDHVWPLDTLERHERPDSLWLAWAGLPLTEAMKAWALDHHGAPLRRIGNTDAGAWLLSGQPANTERAVLATQLTADPLILVDPSAPYTAALTVRRSDVAARKDGYLCIDLRFRAEEGALGRLVLEHKRGERTVDYEAIPLEGRTSQEAWDHMYVTRPVGLLFEDSDELVCYVWNASVSPLSVSGIRVRVMDLAR